MGTNNRQRRAAKRRRRSNAQSSRPSWRGHGEPWSSTRSSDPLSTSRELVEELLLLAATPGRFVHDVVARLCTLDPELVCEESERFALRSVVALWSRGWQPAEMVRQVRRAASATPARLALVLLAADHTRRQAATLDRRWVDQLDRLEPPRVDSAAGWIARWIEDEQIEWHDAIRAVVALLQCLASLPSIPVLIPPPGVAAGRSDAAAHGARGTDPILERVRALLAKAESTTFEAEAEAFTAKAQELMTRHTIDAAMVSAHGHRADAPISIRVPIDDPYVAAKSLLLHFVAENSRCRAVVYDRLAMAAVIGFSPDVAATEMLFTSLLVQAHTAMLASAASARAGARSRSRAFRSAFLVAYAHRIRERLDEINAAVLTDIEADRGSVLPVLSARSSAVDETVEQMFGKLRTSRVRRGYDAAGWASGQLAADRARLAFGDLARGRAEIRS
jgi:hypothetical protein